jgi:hypothetical protein
MQNALIYKKFKEQIKKIKNKILYLIMFIKFIYLNK